MNSVSTENFFTPFNFYNQTIDNMLNNNFSYNNYTNSLSSNNVIEIPNVNVDVMNPTELMTECTPISNDLMERSLVEIPIEDEDENSDETSFYQVEDEGGVKIGEESFCLRALFEDVSEAGPFPSYRLAREISKLKEAQINFDKKWNMTPLVNFPYKSFNFAPKITKKKVSNNGKILNILHWNASGIIGKNKTDRLELLINIENPAIIRLCETKTNSTTECYIFELARLGYFPIIRSRLNENGEAKCHGGGGGG